MTTVWVTLSIDEASTIAVTATADLAKAAAEKDLAGPLTWTERRDGRFTSTTWDYEVRPFDLALTPREDTP